MLAAMTVVVVERIAQVAIEKPMRARVGDSMSTRPLDLVGGGGGSLGREQRSESK